MARTCSVCRHAAKNDINAVLVAATDSFRTVAARFGLSASALKRHKAAHLPVTLTKATQVAEVVQAGSLLGQLEVLQRKTFAIMVKAEAAGDLRAALLAVHEARETAALLSRVLVAREEEGSVTRRINRAVQEGEVLYDDVCRNGLLNILRDVEGRNQMLVATRRLLGALKGHAHAVDWRRAAAPAEVTEAVGSVQASGGNGRALEEHR